jgi:hypothetical protein
MDISFVFPDRALTGCRRSALSATGCGLASQGIGSGGLQRWSQTVRDKRFVAPPEIKKARELLHSGRRFDLYVPDSSAKLPFSKLNFS